MQNVRWLLVGLVLAYFIFQDEIGGIGSGLLDRWAEAIKKFEGWTTSSLSFRNNNPGNLRPSGQPWQGQVGIDSNNFVVFDTYENGWRALKISLTNAATGRSSVYRPTDSLYAFFGRYAPASDNNYPRQYAEFVAGQLGVDPNIEIRFLV